MSEQNIIKMKVERIDRYNEDYSFDVNVKELIMNLFYQLHGLLKYIEINHTSILDKYIQNLETKFEEVIHELGEGVNIFKEYEKSIDLDTIENFPDLSERYRRVIEISLNLPEYKIQPDINEVNITAFDRFRGVKIPLYLTLITLAETIPKEAAINLYKELTDKRSKPSKDREPHMHKIDEMLDLYRESFPNTHVYSLFKLEEGNVVCRIDRCMIYEVLEDFDKDLDTDIAYLTACLNDYGHARMVNHNFVLTREKTIMELDENCDFCWHDKSIQKEITHPNQEFWEELD